MEESCTVLLREEEERTNDYVVEGDVSFFVKTKKGYMFGEAKSPLAILSFRTKERAQSILQTNCKVSDTNTCASDERENKTTNTTTTTTPNKKANETMTIHKVFLAFFSLKDFRCHFFIIENFQSLRYMYAYFGYLFQ